MTEAEFDDLLRRALIQAVREEYAPVLAEAEAGPPPDFSAHYRRRRLKMLNDPFGYVKRAARPVWRKALRGAACILLVAALAFGSLMAVSPTARAWVQEVFTQWLETRARFVFTENPSTGTETGEWKTGYLPEGFEIVRETTGKQVTEVVYQNDVGESIYLTYWPATGGNIFTVDNEHQGYAELQINGNPAYLIEAKEADAWSNLIWMNEEGSVAFKLMSRVESRELIHIAENMVPEE